MRKHGFHFVVYRYEAILTIIILVLTGSIAVSSRDKQSPPPPEPPAPYKIAITFDDGPRPHYTEQLLNILKANNVRATFFVVGNQVKLFPGLLWGLFWPVPYCA